MIYLIVVLNWTSTFPSRMVMITIENPIRRYNKNYLGLISYLSTPWQIILYKSQEYPQSKLDANIGVT